ncbi:unnamed protein product [Closterium sp. NIES-54]
MLNPRNESEGVSEGVGEGVSGESLWDQAKEGGVKEKKKQKKDGSTTKAKKGGKSEEVGETIKGEEGKKGEEVGREKEPRLTSPTVQSQRLQLQAESSGEGALLAGPVGLDGGKRWAGNRALRVAIPLDIPNDEDEEEEEEEEAEEGERERERERGDYIKRALLQRGAMSARDYMGRSSFKPAAVSAAGGARAAPALTPGPAANRKLPRGMSPKPIMTPEALAAYYEKSGTPANQITPRMGTGLGSKTGKGIGSRSGWGRKTPGSGSAAGSAAAASDTSEKTPCAASNAVAGAASNVAASSRGFEGWGEGEVEAGGEGRCGGIARGEQGEEYRSLSTVSPRSATEMGFVRRGSSVPGDSRGEVRCAGVCSSVPGDFTTPTLTIPTVTTRIVTPPSGTPPSITPPSITPPRSTTPKSTPPRSTTSNSTTPVNTTPKGTTSTSTTPKSTTPKSNTPDRSTANYASLSSTTLKGTPPKGTTPKSTTPKITTPRSTTPRATTPRSNSPITPTASFSHPTIPPLTSSPFWPPAWVAPWKSNTTTTSSSSREAQQPQQQQAQAKTSVEGGVHDEGYEDGCLDVWDTEEANHSKLRLIRHLLSNSQKQDSVSSVDLPSAPEAKLAPPQPISCFPAIARIAPSGGRPPLWRPPRGGSGGGCTAGMRNSVPLWAVTIESCSEDEDSSDDSNAYDSDSDNSSFSDLGSPESEQMIVQILAAREAMGARSAPEGGIISSSSSGGGGGGGGGSSTGRGVEQRVAAGKTAEGADSAPGAAHGVATVTARVESDRCAELASAACATGHATGHAVPKVSNNSDSATSDSEAGAAERVMGSSGVAGRAAIGSNVAAHARSVSVSDAVAAGAGHDKTHQWLMSRYFDSAAQPSADPFLRRSSFRLDLPLTAAAAAPSSPATPSPRAAAYSASGSPLLCSADRFHYSPSGSYYSASPAPYAQMPAPLRCYSASRSAWAQPTVIPKSQSATARGDPYAFLHASPFRYSHDCYDSDEEKNGYAGDDGGGDSNDGDYEDADADENGGDSSSSGGGGRAVNGGRIGGERSKGALRSSSRRNPIHLEKGGWATTGESGTNEPINTESDDATSAIRAAPGPGEAATWPSRSGGPERMGELRRVHVDLHGASSTGSNSPCRNAFLNNRSREGCRSSRFGGGDSNNNNMSSGSSGGGRSSGSTNRSSKSSSRNSRGVDTAAAAASAAAAAVNARQVANNATVDWGSPVTLLPCRANKAGILMEPCDTNEAAYIENQRLQLLHASYERPQQPCEHPSEPLRNSAAPDSTALHPLLGSEIVLDPSKRVHSGCSCRGKSASKQHATLRQTS